MNLETQKCNTQPHFRKKLPIHRIKSLFCEKCKEGRLYGWVFEVYTYIGNDTRGKYIDPGKRATLKTRAPEQEHISTMMMMVVAMLTKKSIILFSKYLALLFF